MSFRKVEDNILIILEVFKGDETPYYYYNDGSLEAYIRIGNESVKSLSYGTSKISTTRP